MVTEEPPEKLLRAGELARLAGVSKDTLRFYERRGLLPPPRREANQYRQYPASALSQVLRIRRLLTLGFSIAELAPILAERNVGGVPCRKVREMGAEKLREMEERARELTLACETMRDLLAEWDRRLAESAAGQRAGLLENLPGIESIEHVTRFSASRKTYRKKGKGIES